jgi:hypothetical protein
LQAMQDRWQFFELAKIAANALRGEKAPVISIALEAIKRTDALFDIKREINGHGHAAAGQRAMCLAENALAEGASLET